MLIPHCDYVTIGNHNQSDLAPLQYHLGVLIFFSCVCCRENGGFSRIQCVWRSCLFLLHTAQHEAARWDALLPFTIYPNVPAIQSTCRVPN